MSQSAPSALVKDCVAAGDGGRERHIQRAAELFLSLRTKGRGLSFSQKCGRMSGAAEDGTCTTGTCPALYYHTDEPGPNLTIQITPNQSFWDFCITKSIWQVCCQEGLGRFDCGLIREDIKSLTGFTDGWYWEPAWLLCFLNLYPPLTTEPPSDLLLQMGPFRDSSSS